MCGQRRWPTWAQQPPESCYYTAGYHKAVHAHAVEQDRASLKAVLAQGHPICFGFAVFESLETQEVANGDKAGWVSDGTTPWPAGFRPDATAADLKGEDGIVEGEDGTLVSDDGSGKMIPVTDGMAQCAKISEKCLGGHAVAIVGYDDQTQVRF